VIAGVLGFDVKKEIDKAEVEGLTRQLAGVGLATVLPHGYLRFHPALAPALARELEEGERDEVWAVWWEGTEGFLRFLYSLQFNKPEVVANLILLDLPNLLAVVEAVDADADPERVVDVATHLEGLLQNLNRPRALARIVAVREAAAGALEDWSHARFQASSAAVRRFLDAGRFSEGVAAAGWLVEQALAAGEDAYSEAPYDLAAAHSYLGRAVQKGGAAEGSLEPLEEAQRRFQELAAAGSFSAAHMAGVVLADLGDSLAALGRLDDAARAYEGSIHQAEEVDNPRQAAVGKLQLGTVRLRQGRSPEALAAYEEAREVFDALGDPGTVAVAWHQIGMVHQEVGEHNAAEDAYRRSLKLEVERGNHSGEAATLNQLGKLSMARDRPEEAVRFFRQAAEIHQTLGDRAAEGRDRSNIANPLIQLGRHDEARRELERAIECKAPYGHAAEPWKTFDILEDLERAVGDEEAATEARRRAIRAYLAYRRDGGENHTPGGKLAAAVQEALDHGAPGQVEELDAEAARLRERPDLPAAANALLLTLQALLAGSREPALAEDPALTYDAAAEILLLLERLG
jgi:tetratricopeptide (TPR) repeat protein